MASHNLDGHTVDGQGSNSDGGAFSFLNPENNMYSSLAISTPNSDENSHLENQDSPCKNCFLQIEHQLYEMMKAKSSDCPSKKDGDIRVASWNLNNYNKYEVFWHKMHLVCETIKCYNFDIVALQEVGEQDNTSFTDGSAAIAKLKQELGSDWSIVCTECKLGSIKQNMSEYGVFLYNNKSVSYKNNSCSYICFKELDELNNSYSFLIPSDTSQSAKPKKKIRKTAS